MSKTPDVEPGAVPLLALPQKPSGAIDARLPISDPPPVTLTHGGYTWRRAKPKAAVGTYALRIGPSRQAQAEREETMMTEIAGVILVVLFVGYSIRTAWSGMHGRRPKGPMV